MNLARCSVFCSLFCLAATSVPDIDRAKAADTPEKYSLSTELKVIDFDDCGFGWYMDEAATPLSFYEHLPQVSGLIEHWLEGYRTVRVVTKADEELIPTFVMLRRLLLVAWVGSHAETDLARRLGVSYTDQTVALCSDYLSRNAP